MPYFLDPNKVGRSFLKIFGVLFLLLAVIIILLLTIK